MPSARVDDGVSRVHLPLMRLGLCLDCEACFDFGAGACPACGSTTWMLLARFMETARRRRMVQSVDALGPSHPGGLRRAGGANHFVIVAGDREALYQHFKESFAGSASRARVGRGARRRQNLRRRKTRP